MLVSKWAALSAFVGSGVLLIVIMLVFGSAATFFFWAKWLAKIVAGRPDAPNVEAGVHTSEWVALGIMAALLVLCSVLLPMLSSTVVSPFVLRVTGGALADPTISDLVIMGISALIMILVPFLFNARAQSLSHGDGHQPNFGGVGLSASSFVGALGGQVAYEQRNWYMEDVFGENKLGTVGTIICAIIIGMAIAAAIALTVLFLGSVI